MRTLFPNNEQYLFIGNRWMIGCKALASMAIGATTRGLVPTFFATQTLTLKAIPKERESIANDFCRPKVVRVEK
jgi:hypothetical protein